MKYISLCFAMLVISFQSRAQAPTLNESVTHIIHFIQGKEKIGDAGSITNGDTTIRLYGKYLAAKISGAQGTIKVNADRSVMIIINNATLADAQANEEAIIATAQQNLNGLALSQQNLPAAPGSISNKTYIVMIGSIMTTVNLQIVSNSDAAPEKKYKQMVMFDLSKF